MVTKALTAPRSRENTASTLFQRVQEDSQSVGVPPLGGFSNRVKPGLQQDQLPLQLQVHSCTPFQHARPAATEIILWPRQPAPGGLLSSEGRWQCYKPCIIASEPLYSNPSLASINLRRYWGLSPHRLVKAALKGGEAWQNRRCGRGGFVSRGRCSSTVF